MSEFTPTPEITTDPMTPDEICRFVTDFRVGETSDLTDEQRAKIIHEIAAEVKSMFEPKALEASPSWHALAGSTLDTKLATRTIDDDFDHRVATVLTNLLLRKINHEGE